MSRSGPSSNARHRRRSRPHLRRRRLRRRRRADRRRRASIMDKDVVDAGDVTRTSAHGLLRHDETSASAAGGGKVFYVMMEYTSRAVSLAVARCFGRCSAQLR